MVSQEYCQEMLHMRLVNVSIIIISSISTPVNITPNTYQYRVSLQHSLGMSPIRNIVSITTVAHTLSHTFILQLSLLPSGATLPTSTSLFSHICINLPTTFPYNFHWNNLVTNLVSYHATNLPTSLSTPTHLLVQ